MSTPASLAQGQKFLDLLRGTTTEEIQTLLENGDLLKAMLRADLSEVDRVEFEQVLASRREAVQTTSYYTTADEQLDAVRRLNVEKGWGFTEADFPATPVDFTPTRPTETLLLAAYLPGDGRKTGLERTFMELWTSIVSPASFEKLTEMSFQTDHEHMRVIGGNWNPGLRWVAFDPAAYPEYPARDALNEAILAGYNLAGVEVLMATLLFPRWAELFANRQLPRPALSGLRLLEGGRWASIPFFGNWAGGSRFGLGLYGATSRLAGCSSPTVRQLV